MEKKGYVRFQEPTTDTDGKPTVRDRTYAITNALVALESGPSGLFQEMRWDRSNTQQSPQMQSPSHQDHVVFETDRQRSIKIFEEAIRRDEKRVLIQQANSPNSVDALDDRTATNKSIIADLEGDLKLAQEDRRMGRVTGLAFGKRNDYENHNFEERSAMDIALVDVTQSVPSPEKVLLPVLKGRAPLYSPQTVWNTWDVNGLPGGNDKKGLAILGRTSGVSWT